MKIKEVKELLYQITGQFFQGATVIWAETSSTEPELPFVTLRVRTPKSVLFPDTDAELESTYASSFMLEVNLYTNGRKRTNIETENTASADLQDFVRFLGSPELEDVMAREDISIMPEYPIQDLSGVFAGVKYRYRAMVTLKVDYTDKVSGLYEMLGNTVPNPSGGGTIQQAAEPLQTIETVDNKIEEERN